MLKTMTYIYPRNTFSIMAKRNSIVRQSRYIIENIVNILKISGTMLLVGAAMVSGLFIVVGCPYFIASLFI